MRVIIVDLYKMIYSRTRATWPSVLLAVIYITILNLITIKGLALLMENWLPPTKYVKVLFRFPIIIFPALIILSINYMLITPLKNLKKERQKKPHAMPIIVYTGACVILVLYMLYGNKLF